MKMRSLSKAIRNFRATPPLMTAAYRTHWAFKAKLLVIVLAYVACIANAGDRFVADWTRVKPYISTSDREKGTGTADYSFEVRDGVLTFTVKSLTNATVKALIELPASKIPYAGRYMTLRAFVSGDGIESCDALLQGYIDRAGDGKDRKHYWKPATLPVMGEPSVWMKTRYLDPKLTELSFTFVMGTPGTYRFHSLEFFEAPDPMSAYRPGHNYLANGGAEQGLYATSAVGEPAVRFGTKGGVIEPNKGVFFKGMLKPSVSETVAHSGKRSFELQLPDGHDGRLYFNPVPTVDDREFVFSFWVKASKNCQVRAGLFVASGAAYEKSFNATTEWTRISLRVSRWGKIGEDGLSFYGKVTEEGLVVPYVEPLPGATYWIDDAFASVGTPEGEPDLVTEAISVTRTGAPRGIYRPGEIIKGIVRVMSCSVAANNNLTLERRLYDWRNREIAVADEKIPGVVAPMSEVDLPFELRPPEGQRGPMTAVWSLKDGDKVLSTAVIYFGLQPECDKVNPRLSLNVMFGSPEQSLLFMKEFGVGGARLWGPGRNWDLDMGYAYTRLFHEAGIRNLFVLGSPHLFHDGKRLRGEALVPVDTSDWFARQMELVDQHRGEVDIYEFLNEYNIWNGRIASPDPTLFAEPTMSKYIEMISAFRPLLREHDPNALLAGCATCSTDLKFIGKFLERGGGRHVDMITEHAYSGNPDCPDYARKLDTGLALAKNAGVNRWAQTEAGATSPNHLVPGLIHPRALHQVSNDLRNMLIAWAKGLDHYSHFMLTTGRAGTDWNFTYLGNGDNDFQDLPKPALFAFRVAADILRDAQCTAEAKLGGGCKGYVFDRRDTRVAVIWKWSGGTAALKPVPALKDAEWFDTMGNRIRSDEVELSEYPVYCVTTLSAADVAHALELGPRAAVDGSGEAVDASDQNLLTLPH